MVSDPSRPLASLAVLAIRAGEVVYEGHFGKRRMGDAHPASGLPANDRTLYKIASITKLVTAIGAVRLVQDGRLELDRDIGDYLGYRVRNPHFPDVPVTLRMLLSHTSSLRDDAGYFWSPQRTIRDVLVPDGANYGKGEAWGSEAAPGAFFSYANLPWGVIGTVMEAASGERFDRLMQRLVVEPLRLGGGYDPASFPAERIADIAVLYRKASAGDVQSWDPDGPWIAQADDFAAAPPTPRAPAGYKIGTNGSLYSPQSGLRASAADLGRVMRMLMRGGELDGSRVLGEDGVQLLLSRQWTYTDSGRGRSTFGSKPEWFNAWGLGNQHFLDLSAGPGRGDRLVEGGGFTGVGHIGDAYGLTGTFVFDPASRNGLVYLIGGHGFNPATHPGRYSAFPRHEELIMTAVYRNAIQ